MKHARTRPDVKRYPPDDAAFRDRVEASIGAVARQPIEDERILAAVTAMVRSTYPLATVRVRFEKSSSAESSWDVFRDESVLDNEMLLRARTGDRVAMEELFDRHHALVYRVATRMAPQSHMAAAAVVAAFRTLVADRQAAWPPRVRLGMASCDAAREAAPAHAPSREDVARLVVELAHLDNLSATEISAVLQLDIRRVAALAIEGLRNGRSTRDLRPGEAAPLS